MSAESYVRKQHTSADSPCCKHNHGTWCYYIEFSFLLSQNKDLVKGPLGQPHPLLVQGPLRLATWKVSSNSMLQLEFWGRLQDFPRQVGTKEPTRPINQDGDDRSAGARRGISIPLSCGINLFVKFIADL